MKRLGKILFASSGAALVSWREEAVAAARGASSGSRKGKSTGTLQDASTYAVSTSTTTTTATENGELVILGEIVTVALEIGLTPPEGVSPEEMAESPEVQNALASGISAGLGLRADQVEILGVKVLEGSASSSSSFLEAEAATRGRGTTSTRRGKHHVRGPRPFAAGRETGSKKNRKAARQSASLRENEKGRRPGRRAPGGRYSSVILDEQGDGTIATREAKVVSGVARKQRKTGTAARVPDQQDADGQAELLPPAVKEGKATTSVLETSGRDVLEEPCFRIMIFSARKNREKRDATRRYWLNEFNAKPADGKKLAYFVLGTHGCELLPGNRENDFSCDAKPEAGDHAEDATDPKTDSGEEQRALVAREQKLSAELQEEQSEFGDLLLLDMVDVYWSLPRKQKLSLKWFAEEFQDASTGLQWIVKVDDDNYVRPWLLQRYLSNSEEAWNNEHDARKEGLIVGSMFNNMPVETDAASQFADNLYYNRKRSDEVLLPYLHSLWLDLLWFLGVEDEVSRTRVIYPTYPSGATATAFSWYCATSVAKNVDRIDDHATTMNDAAVGIWVDEEWIDAKLFAANETSFHWRNALAEQEEWKKYYSFHLSEAAVLGHDLNTTHKCILHYLDRQKKHTDDIRKKAEDECRASGVWDAEEKRLRVGIFVPEDAPPVQLEGSASSSSSSLLDLEAKTAKSGRGTTPMRRRRSNYGRWLRPRLVARRHSRWQNGNKKNRGAAWQSKVLRKDEKDRRPGSRAGGGYSFILDEQGGREDEEQQLRADVFAPEDGKENDPQLGATSFRNMMRRWTERSPSASIRESISMMSRRAISTADAVQLQLDVDYQITLDAGADTSAVTDLTANPAALVSAVAGPLTSALEDAGVEPVAGSMVAEPVAVEVVYKAPAEKTESNSMSAKFEILLAPVEHIFLSRLAEGTSLPTPEELDAELEVAVKEKILELYNALLSVETDVIAGTGLGELDCDTDFEYADEEAAATALLGGEFGFDTLLDDESTRESGRPRSAGEERGISSVTEGFGSSFTGLVMGALSGHAEEKAAKGFATGHQQPVAAIPQHYDEYTISEEDQRNNLEDFYTPPASTTLRRGLARGSQHDVRFGAPELLASGSRPRPPARGRSFSRGSRRGSTSSYGPAPARRSLVRRSRGPLTSSPFIQRKRKESSRSSSTSAERPAALRLSYTLHWDPAAVGNNALAGELETFTAIDKDFRTLLADALVTTLNSAGGDSLGFTAFDAIFLGAAAGNLNKLDEAIAASPHVVVAAPVGQTEPEGDEEGDTPGVYVLFLPLALLLIGAVACAGAGEQRRPDNSKTNTTRATQQHEVAQQESAPPSVPAPSK